MAYTDRPNAGQRDHSAHRTGSSRTVPHGETLSAKSLPEISSGCLLYRWPGEKQPPIYGDAGPILSADGEDCEWGITRQSDDPTTMEGCSLMTAIGTLGEAPEWHGVAWPAGQQRPLLFRVIDHIKGLLEPYGLSVAGCLDRVKEIAKAKPNGLDPAPTAVDRADLTELDYCMLNTVKARPVSWLWRPYIPLRANTLFYGDSDVGKSKAVASIIAIVTRGGTFPMTDEKTPARNVIVLAAEEDTVTMLKPSLIAAGADTTKIAVVNSCATYDSQGRMKRRMVTLEKDIDNIRKLARQLGDVGLIDIDPITSYLGTRIDSNNNSAIRAVLQNLQALVEEYDAASILVTHPGKDNTRNAKQSVLGATAFVAGVRSVIGFFLDPDDHNRRLMLPVKCNLVARSERQGRAFVIEGETVTDEDNTPIPTAAVRWLNESVTQTAEQVRKAEQAQATSPVSEEREAVLAVLHAAGHPMTSRRIAEAIHEEDIPDFSDSRRARVRKLLGRMLTAGQVQQLPDHSYIASPPGSPVSMANNNNTVTGSHSVTDSHRCHSSHRTHISSNESVTPVTCDRLYPHVTPNCTRCHSFDPAKAGCRHRTGVIPMEQRANPPCTGADFEPKEGSHG